jgi:hypothetical protein
MDFRIRMVHERLNYNKSEALAYILKIDEQRRRWTSFLYGVEWDDLSLYDLVLNLEHMTLETACHIISAAVRRRCSELTPACWQELEDLALASKVKAALAITPSTEGLVLEVKAENGIVTVKGNLSDAQQFTEAERIAREVPGVISLSLDRLSPPMRVYFASVIGQERRSDMDLYLPVAAISINAFLVITVGALIGLLSGLVGVGGGFLLTPILMMIGVPPTIAAASDTCALVGTSSSATSVHFRMGNVDLRLGCILLLGGLSGAAIGVHVIKLLRAL